MIYFHTMNASATAINSQPGPHLHSRNCVTERTEEETKRALYLEHEIQGSEVTNSHVFERGKASIFASSA